MDTVYRVIDVFWLGMAAHLWQTTLVLAVLFVLGAALRGAPARVVHTLWWIGLAKLLLPLPVFGPLGFRAVSPMLGEVVVTGGRGSTLSAWAARASGFLDPLSTTVAGTLSSHRPFLLGLTAVWVAVAAALSVPLFFRRRGGSRGVAEDPGGELGTRLGAALQGTAIPVDAVEITPEAAGPSVTGLVRPKIRVPSTLLLHLQTEELRAVLLHEDEHRRRLDPLRAVLQRLVLALFFFYPLLWPLLGRLRVSAEMACDEAALGAGIAPRAYARALARTLRLELAPASAPAFGSRGSSLLRARFSRLEEFRRYAATRRHRLTLAVAGALVGIASFLPFSSTARSGSSDEITLPVLLRESYVAPVYPRDARRDGVEGTVLVRVQVDREGHVAEARVEKGVPGYPSLEESAVAAVHLWRFDPGEKDGRPAAVEVSIPIRFRLQ